MNPNTEKRKCGSFNVSLNVITNKNKNTKGEESSMSTGSDLKT